KTRLAKIAAAVMVLFFIGAGAALADGGKGRGHQGRPGHSYGYHKHHGPPAHVYAPRHVYHKHHHHYYHPRYPVVVQKHYYSPPAYYYYYPAPAPSGFYFGVSGYEPGFGFSFGLSGR
ncbi:MAG: hypothetical protein MUF46_08555, partial [Desulfobacterales bacterium]|nr:hypothetical protein [Desulfobacterales bacterium]